MEGETRSMKKKTIIKPIHKDNIKNQINKIKENQHKFIHYSSC